MTAPLVLTRRPGMLSVLVLLAGAASRAGAEDVIEKLNGITLRGEVVEQEPERVKLRVTLASGRNIVMTVPAKDIHAITIDGERKVLNERRARRKPTPRPPRRQEPKPPTPRRPPAAPKPKPPPGSTRTRSQVLALIRKAGARKPDWWDSVQLDYPKTLDLSWPRPSGGWNTRKNVGQYMWSVVNENPGRWKEGTKFMHYVLKVNDGNPAARKNAMGALAHCYHDLLEDWARGAYWWLKDGGGELHKVIGLADSYWKLGSKEMAVELLARIGVDPSRYGSVIKLWSDMGELRTALKVAEASARAGRPGGAYMAAGDACRRHGRYRLAITYYEKVLAVPVRPNDGIQKKSKDRARAAIRNIRMFEKLDLNRVRDGTYAGRSVAYAGDLTVSVTVAAARITSVRVTGHKDKQYYSALSDTPRRIIAKQSLKDIDATTGATLTSDGIVNAVADALSKGLR